MKQGDVTYRVPLACGVLTTNKFSISLGSNLLGRPCVNADRDLAIIACVIHNLETGYTVESACRLTAAELLSGGIEGYKDSITFRRIQQIYQGRDKSSEE
tara:strand:+ start:149 stop:448 length:300 start_codon:yes stop_codon:yes gene_type:complete